MHLICWKFVTCQPVMLGDCFATRKESKINVISVYQSQIKGNTLIKSVNGTKSMTGYQGSIL